MRTHILDPYTNAPFCKARPFHVPPEIAANEHVATCGVCRDIKIRDNRVREKGEHSPQGYNLRYVDEEGKEFRARRLKNKRALEREDGKVFSHSYAYVNWEFMGRITKGKDARQAEAIQKTQA